MARSLLLLAAFLLAAVPLVLANERLKIGVKFRPEKCERKSQACLILPVSSLPR